LQATLKKRLVLSKLNFFLQRFLYPTFTSHPGRLEPEAIVVLRSVAVAAREGFVVVDRAVALRSLLKKKTLK